MMNGWKEVKIGDLGQIVTGNTPPRKQPELYGKHTLFVKPTDINLGEKYCFEPEECYSEKGFVKYKKSLIPKNATCVVTIGSIGQKMIKSHTDLFINQAMNAIIPNDDYDEDFVYYLLKLNLFQLKIFDSGTASGRENVSKSSFSNIKVTVPKSKETQRKIASILSAYDDLMENNLKRIKLLEEQAQQTYEEWFVRFKFPGYEDVVFDDVSGLPVGWELHNLGEVIEITSSKRIFLSDYVSEGIPFYRGKEIILKSKNEALNDRLYISVKKFNEIKTKYDVPTEGDILVTAVGTLGYPYLVTKSDGDFYFKDGNLIWLKGNKKISSTYLISSFKNQHFQTMLINIAIGSSQKALTIKSLNAIKHIIPELSIQMQYDNIVIPIYNSIENLQNQNQLLKEARDILLPRLMSGMIDVDGLEVGEPLGMVAEESETYNNV